jgi:hypothetical protein
VNRGTRDGNGRGMETKREGKERGEKEERKERKREGNG